MAETNFEKSLNQLESIVEKLESGDLSLEESLKQFEEGVKVTQALNKRLEEAQRKVELLLKNPSGGSTRQAFEETPGAAEKEPVAAPPRPKAPKGKKTYDQNTLF